MVQMKRIKQFSLSQWLLIGLLLMVLLLCACQSKPEEPDSQQTNITTSTSAIHFVDDDGVTIDLEQPCEKIISLYSAHTENLFVLGAGDKLIGGHTTCVYPPAAAFLPTYDYTGDVEQVIAAQPDLVLIRPFIRRKVPGYVEQLELAGIPVVSLYPDSYDEFDAYIRRLAILTGTEEKADEELQLFHEQIEEITRLTSQANKKQTVFLEATETNLRTVTPDSMAGRAIEFAGGINIAGDVKASEKGSSIAEFGVERVLQHADDIDVYVSQRGAMNSGGNLISIGERAGFDTIKAVKEERIYLINEKIISSPTFRYVKGVREMARFLYPEIMDELSTAGQEGTVTKAEYAEFLMKQLHLPLYLPSSSKYYKTAQKGHTFGLFEDVTWEQPQFDAVETAVFGGYIEWERVGEKEYFYPQQKITREDLAKTIFLAGEFKNAENHTKINDLQECEKPKIVQILVDNGVFTLEDGLFQPKREVSLEEVVTALSQIEK